MALGGHHSELLLMVLCESLGVVIAGIVVATGLRVHSISPGESACCTECPHAIRSASGLLRLLLVTSVAAGARNLG